MLEYMKLMLISTQVEDINGVGAEYGQLSISLRRVLSLIRYLLHFSDHPHFLGQLDFLGCLDF